MDASAHLAGLLAESELLLDALGAGAAAAVPACPGWDVADLVRHTGAMHRWATAAVRGGLAGDVGAPATPEPEVARDEMAAWFADGVADLVALLAGSDLDTNCWTFGAPRSARFWARRMCHETTVHRVDAQTALGVPDPVEASLAADGVDEVLSVVLRLGLRARRSAPSRSLHLHRTDPGEGPEEWMVEVGDDGTVVVRHEHGKGDVAVRGTASDLLLFLWGRRVPGEGSLEVHGDGVVAAEWGTLTP